jgi:hypothetical protein
MNRTTIYLCLSLAMAVALLAGCSSTNTPTNASSSTPSAGAPSGTTASAVSLTFPKDTYTVTTTTVTTAEGDKKVTYHLYQHLTYVAKPVDANYESLDVKVPVEIDGVAIDAAKAPILFDIAVGGYMSVSNTASGGTSGGGPPGGGFPSGQPPGGTMPGSGASGTMPAGGPPSGALGGPGPGGGGVSNADLALAAGYVVVSPGCRGRDNVTPDGKYYGKAPAAIVDLKSAVKYIRFNKGVIPGNTDWIISNGTSAGGALSALVGASGDSHLYDAYFKELGAADASDAIFASACYCPITDLENADGAYEWMFGTTPLTSGQVDQALSEQLKAIFAPYQASLNLQGENGFGTITADNYGDYLMKTYLVPAANKYLSALSDADRATYLANNPWLKWENGQASFTFADYVTHVGRMKGLPAFDDFNLAQAENILFGNETTNARNFTDFSLRHATGNNSAQIDSDLPATLNLMNPMYFIGQNNSGCANNWWIRYGTKDSNTSLTVIANLAAALQNKDKNVSSLMYWDAGHGANEDAPDFIKWIGTTTGYTK